MGRSRLFRPWCCNDNDTSKSDQYGNLTLPCQIRLRFGGKLSSEPVTEVEKLCEDEQYYAPRAISESEFFPVTTGMEFIAKPVQALICLTGAEHIIFRLRGSTAQETNLELELSLGELIFDRTLSGKISALQRNCLLESASQSQLIVRIFLDSILIEIFTDGGRNTMTNNIFSSPERTQLSISTVSGSACLGGLWPMG